MLKNKENIVLIIGLFLLIVGAIFKTLAANGSTFYFVEAFFIGIIFIFISIILYALKKTK